MARIAATKRLEHAAPRTMKSDHMGYGQSLGMQIRNLLLVVQSAAIHIKLRLGLKLNVFC